MANFDGLKFTPAFQITNIGKKDYNTFSCEWWWPNLMANFDGLKFTQAFQIKAEDSQKFMCVFHPFALISNTVTLFAKHSFKLDKHTLFDSTLLNS